MFNYKISTVTKSFLLALLLTSLAAAKPARIPQSGLVVTPSANDFETTVTRLNQAIENNKSLTLMLKLDHTQNATSVDLTLRPTTLFIFGNPKAGTPLMQESATLGIDLPQKILVVQDDSGVKLIYNDPTYLASRHDVSGQKKRLQKIGSLLQTLADTAASK